MTDYFLAGLACSLLIPSSYIIIDTAMHYEPPVVREPTDKRPEIPYCDKEMWERIRFGCAALQGDK